jgi:hypothetical protein
MATTFILGILQRNVIFFDHFAFKTTAESPKLETSISHFKKYKKLPLYHEKIKVILGKMG